MSRLADELRQPSLEQVVKNHMKVARAAIRLKHSIAADNELAALLPVIKARLALQMQSGHVDGLTVPEMLELIAGDDE